MTQLGASLPDIRIDPPGPRSKELAERLRSVESRNVTHLSPEFPVFWAEAVGANVRDVDDNVYIDLTGAFGVALGGHAHPGIRERLAVAASRLVHGMGDVHPSEPKVELLERLAALSPWDEARGILASTGSEAVEIALKTALLATGKAGVLAFEGGYHGLTMGSLAVTARSYFREPFGERVFDGVGFAPFPERTDDVEAALTAVEAALEGRTSSGHPIGAVIIEPIQGRAGVRIPEPGFLAQLADRAGAAGALLIFDEIFTGFGRTGTNFAFVHEDVVPDLLCVGKALGGGLPLSACIGSAEVMAAWPESTGEALHTSTFLGHPLSCAAALAFLDALDDERLADRARELGEALATRLRNDLAGVSGVLEVRGRGLFIGVELEETRGGETTVGERVAVEALRRGLLVLPAGEAGQVIELTPPATLTAEQAEVSAHLLVEAVRSVVGGG